MAQSGLKEYLAGGFKFAYNTCVFIKDKLAGLVCCAECIITEIEEETPDFNWSDSVISGFQSIAISFSINRGLV